MFGEVAEESDGVPFDVTSPAFGAWLVVDGQPEKGHCADRTTHLAFKLVFHLSDFQRGIGAFAPRRQQLAAPREKARSNQEPEDGAPMVAAARAH
ncbi:MAG: hypothetical protein ACT4O6_25105 [Reyranella sp.]